MGWRTFSGLTRVPLTCSVVLMAGLATTGCTSHARDGAGSADVVPSMTAAIGQPGAGAPSFCQSLAADSRLQDLPQVLRAAMVGGSDQSQVAAAVAALRQYAADGLGQPALNVAADLAAVAKDPASETAVNSFATAARRLDQAMEAKCHTS
ncbi:MAG TPA: hypothetical protein VHZ03_15265 [Trebonia sp.]|nr:hypothetical protein [Trebonia sp.]